MTRRSHGTKSRLCFKTVQKCSKRFKARLFAKNLVEDVLLRSRHHTRRNAISSALTFGSIVTVHLSDDKSSTVIGPVPSVVRPSEDCWVTQSLMNTKSLTFPFGLITSLMVQLSCFKSSTEMAPQC